MVNTRLGIPAAFLLMFAPAMALAQLQPVVPPPQGVLPPPAESDHHRSVAIDRRLPKHDRQLVFGSCSIRL